MINRPRDFSAFEFVILSARRAAQLMRGCTPRVVSTHKVMVTAQMEVAAGKIGRGERTPTEIDDRGQRPAA